MSLTSSRASLPGQEPELARGLALQRLARQVLLALGSPAWGHQQAWSPQEQRAWSPQEQRVWSPQEQRVWSPQEQQAWSTQEQRALHPLGASPSPHPQALSWEWWQPQALGWQEPQVQQRQLEVP